MQDASVNEAIRVDWRKKCRALGHHKEAQSDHLLFSSPDVMTVFTQRATTLPELTAELPLLKGNEMAKNRKARFRRRASSSRPICM